VRIPTPAELHRCEDTHARKGQSGSLAIALWNYAAPGKHGSTKRIKLVIKGLRRPHRWLMHLLDQDHSSPLATWEKTGRPDWPTRAEQAELRASGELGPPRISAVRKRERSSMTFDLRPHSLVLIEVVSSQRITKYLARRK